MHMKKETRDERNARLLKEQQQRWKNAYNTPKEPRNPNVAKDIQDVGSQVWFDNTMETQLIKILNKMVMDGLIKRHESRPVIDKIVAGKRGAVPNFPFHEVE